MTNGQRITNFFIGLFMIPAAVLMMISPEYGYDLIIAALCIGLTVGGLRMLWYYFTMARHMVGGKRNLYLGVIVLDFGLFTAGLSYIPGIYIMLYLIGIHMFAGLVDIWAAADSKRLGAASWRLKFSRGVINVIIGITCFAFITHRNTAVYIYCAGMIYNGIMRIITAFRKTAMVFIP